MNEHVTVVVDWEQVDLRKNLGEKQEALAALSAESKVCIVDDDLLKDHGIDAKARVCMPGITDEDLSKTHVASNTRINALAAIGNRHYAKKTTEVTYEGIKYENLVGNPTELIRRATHCMVNTIFPALLNIDEAEIRRVESEAIEIPMSEVVSELHGKSVFPIHKIIEEIAPNSFTAKMVEENFEAVSGTAMPKEPITKAFVKPNETLGKIKPRLIQHKGPSGTAMNSLMNKTIEEFIFRLLYFLLRSLKGTDHHGLNQRILAFFREYRDGGFASTDFGSFDSSVTDKCTGDTSKPGIRRIIEEALMNSIASKFPDSLDLKNAAGKRWKQKDKVLFDSLTLLTSVLIRYSGDGLASVGNYVINWTVDKVVDAIAEAIFTIWDWSGESLAEIMEALPTMLDEKKNIEKIMEFVKGKAEYITETIIRESTGKPVKKPDAEFMAGEGDDRAKAYRWKFVQHFVCRDKRGKRAREVLGLVTALLYVASGMSLEPQDDTGRVSPEKLIDPPNRIEFVSRIFVPICEGTKMFSFPKLRKTFAAATITFNVADPYSEAAAMKMLSIMSMADQCPLQFAFYSMIFRYHMQSVTDEKIPMEKRKYEWWEYKLVLLIRDNDLTATLSKIYAHLHERALAASAPEVQDEILAAVAREMRSDKQTLINMIDAFDSAQGDGLRSIEDLVQLYAAALPAV